MTDPGMRTPPADVAAERAALGGMLLSARAAGDVRDVVREQDLWVPAHQVIFRVICDLADAGKPCDAVTVADELSRCRDLGRTGGAPYLHTLIASVPVAANAGYYARIVAEKAVLRRLTEAGERIAQLGYGGGDAAELAEEARRITDQVTVAPSGGESLDELLISVMVGLEKGEQPGLPLPWTDVNDLVSGLTGGDVMVIAAGTGVGKSIAGLSIAAHAAIRLGVPSLVCSAEMRRQEVMLRLIASEGRVPLHVLLRRQLSDEHWERVGVAREKIAGAPMVIDDSPGMSAGLVRARLREMTRAGRPCGLVFVDYLQLLAEPARAESRQLAVAANSRALKLIAGEFGVPVVAAAQLNRGPAKRAGNRPVLADLRESGAIEQDASVVLLLHREGLSGKEPKQNGEIEMIVAKNRNGPLGVVTAAFQGHYARIMDMAWSPSAMFR